ncbi:MAG: 3-octaprenyl-4-hydroxybenzoate carboxy-lyase [Leptospiraceae bacterium]|nr:MAG: 3-octaprenyl-4-hydroxybenzoate carboxy-lyase [Leptospiraceae bacterium]
MYRSLLECIIDLEKNNQLIRIKEKIDPYLEMSLVHQILFKQNGPAIFYENIKNTKFPAVSNLFGTYERAKFIFRHSFEKVKKLIEIRANPDIFKKNFLYYWNIPFIVFNTLPKKIPYSKLNVCRNEIQIKDLPQIINWKKDGGPFITLPIVLSYDVENPHILKTNLGMYRIQLSGNRYKINQEIGLHYQIHRGIGIHHKKALENQKPFKVSIFVGGPPAHILAAVMPLPEGLPEIAFSGALANRRFRYSFWNGYYISSDADFCILGEVQNYLLPEGPFGDHLGYYSLKHHFPVLKIEKVFCRDKAIWPFTVVGRPPQEDTIFGKLIHELTQDMIPVSLPGVKKVHAVDEAGVHPLLLAIGSERYIPYLPIQKQQPMEILTQANAILGFNQLSLAKYLFIVAEEPEVPDINNIENFILYLLERIDFERDLHFITNTTIDTLDYTGTKLNIGSKVIFAATYPKKRNLSNKIKIDLKRGNVNAYEFVSKGILAVEIGPYTKNDKKLEYFIKFIENNYQHFKHLGMIIICDNAKYCAKSFRNFLWITFTRSNPSTDIYGPFSFYNNKHWGCKNPIIIDARIKPHHAPPLEIDKKTLSNIKRFFKKGSSLEKYEFFNPDEE